MLSAVGADRLVGACVWLAWPEVVTVGNRAARWARAVCCEILRPAMAAAMSGLARSERSIRALSGADWNTVHHWPGMSMSRTTRWASPSGMPAETKFSVSLPSSGR